MRLLRALPLAMLTTALLVPAASALPLGCPVDDAFQVCLLNQSTTTGRYEVDALLVQGFHQEGLPTGRGFVSTLTEVDWYQFDTWTTGHGVRAGSGTGVWLFQGNWPPLAGAGVNAAARQYTLGDFGATQASADFNAFVPVGQWLGGTVYYAQSHREGGSCNEYLYLRVYAGGTNTLVPLLQGPCLAAIPNAPPLPPVE